MIVTTTEIQNNFGKYLKEVENGDVIITKNGKKIARLTKYVEYDTDFIIREGSPAFEMPPRKVSYQEFLEISENSEYRYEYIDGEIYLLASSYSHKRRSGKYSPRLTNGSRAKNVSRLIRHLMLLFLRAKIISTWCSRISLLYATGRT